MKSFRMAVLAMVMTIISSVAFAGEIKKVSPVVKQAMVDAERGMAMKLPSYKAVGSPWKAISKSGGCYEKKYIIRGKGKAAETAWLVITKRGEPFVRIGTNYVPLFASN